jgi:L-fuconolactonase
MTFDGAIDAHVHLWDQDREDDILVLQSKPHLKPMASKTLLTDFLAGEKVSGAIVVQSAPNCVHSNWLRQTAREIPNVLGIVGWLDLFNPEVACDIDTLKQDPLVCGIRLMLNRMQRVDELQKPVALSALGSVADADLTIECLCPSQLLLNAAKLARALPSASIVIDHCGLPPADDGEMDMWDQGILELAKQPNVTIKFSGLVEIFGPEVTLADIEGRALRIVELFGPHRLMLASNFPVTDLGGGQKRWVDLLAQLLDHAQLTRDERQALLKGTAISAFGLERR